MGNIQANETKQTLASYTNVINTAMFNAYNESVADCSASDTLEIDTCPTFEIINGSLNVTQAAAANCKFSSENFNTFTAKFTTEVRTATKQFIDENAKNKQGWFATAFSFQINGASNSSEVTNKIMNSFRGSTTNICRSEAAAMNSAKLLLCGTFDGSAINVKQNSTVTSLVSCVNRNTEQAFVSNSVLNELFQKTDQKLASEQAGAGSFFAWIVIAIVAAIILIVIVMIAFNATGGKADVKKLKSVKPGKLGKLGKVGELALL